MKKHFFTLLSIFFLIFLSGIISIFAATTCKDGSCDNNVNGKYVTTDAQRAAAAAYNIKINPDGTYDKQSVRDFQTAQNIKVDGWIGPETAAKLTYLAASIPGGGVGGASTNGGAGNGAGGNGNPTSADGSKNVVIVTELIPGAVCTCIAQSPGNNPSAATTSCGDPKTRKYSCVVKEGLGGFQDIFREITRWVVYITMLLGVFAIAGVGIMMAYTGSSDEGGAKAAKKWAINIVVGLVILFTFRYILGFIAPWIFG